MNCFGVFFVYMRLCTQVVCISVSAFMSSQCWKNKSKWVKGQVHDSSGKWLILQSGSLPCPLILSSF